MHSSKRAQILIPLAVLALIVAACTSAGDDSGNATTSIANATTGSESPQPTVLGEVVVAAEDSEQGEAEPELPFGAEAEVVLGGPASDEAADAAVNKILQDWGVRNGVAVVYQPEANFHQALQLQVRAGAEPDIAIIQTVGQLENLHAQGALKPVPTATKEQVGSSWNLDTWGAFGTVEGTMVGIPLSAATESLVWYQPGVFEEQGYSVPTTFDEFTGLSTQMIANGHTPLCLGLQGGPTATNNFSYTGWLGDLVLNLAPPELYDQWVSHQVPFTDERIVSQIAALTNLWGTPGVVFGGAGLASETSPADHAQDLFEGRCLMQRDGLGLRESLGAFADGSESTFNTFAFPSNQGSPLQVELTFAAVFADRPEVWAASQFLTSAEFVNNLAVAQAGTSNTRFVSLAAGVDPLLYSPLAQTQLRILGNATSVRRHAAVTLPSTIGQGALPAEGLVTATGKQTPLEAAERIEAVWP